MPLIPAVAGVIALGVFLVEGIGAATTFVEVAAVVVVIAFGGYVVYRTL